jgi:hypothetical protein
MCLSELVRVTFNAATHTACPSNRYLIFMQPWFWGWNYHDKIWNNIYRKMAPDDLHTVFGGVLGKHFIKVLTEVGNQLDMEKDKFLQAINTLFHAALVWTGSKERRRHD